MPTVSQKVTGYSAELLKSAFAAGKYLIVRHGLSRKRVLARYYLETDEPVGVADVYTTPFETALVVNAATGVLANDTNTEVGETLTARLLTAPSHGTVVLASDGSFTYTPEDEYEGEDTFTYTVVDSLNAKGTGTVTITVEDEVE